MTTTSDLPFQPDGEIRSLALCYLRVAGQNPAASYSTGDPVGFYDSLALEFLRQEGYITWHVDFKITDHGLKALQSFERSS